MEKTTEIARLKKALEEADKKNSLLQAENSELLAEKVAVEMKLDINIDDTLVMLSQSFFQTVRQAHVLYKGPPSFDDFDPNMDVFEGQILSSSEVKTLKSATQPAPTEGAEDED